MLYVIGIGPGDKDNMTFKAYKAIEEADVIIGYKKYIQLVKNIFPEAYCEDFGMKKETDRCIRAVEIANQGKKVALVSSGDAGIYGMAGLVYQVAEGVLDFEEIEVIPGISASGSCGALLGAPLMHDFATISLSDLLTDWKLIEKRLHLAAEGDYVIVLYNPKSNGRTKHIENARDIILKYRSKDTVSGIVSDAGRKNQSVKITSLEKLCDHEINMTATVIIGNSTTYSKGNQMITPRGYRL
ncbi:MAG: precorrin-3B C(17)-methyltransferase [Tissierellales bacterium]|nr:precorrin-3B C(17)-methyltransferase [Tissierellales bacterium]MBN2826455.1 precorrin-3B C(17)-methyltransferase [Tissierellales bacterium]